MYLKLVWLTQLALLLSTAVLSELCDVEGDERVTDAANRVDVIQICIEQGGSKNWTFVCFLDWGSNEAEVYCRRAGYTQLDFLGIGAHEVVTDGSLKLKNVDCDSDSKSISECNYTRTTEDCKYVADVQCRICDNNNQCNTGTCQNGKCKCASTCLNGEFCYLGDCVCPTTNCSIQDTTSTTTISQITNQTTTTTTTTTSSVSSDSRQTTQVALSATPSNLPTVDCNPSGIAQELCNNASTFSNNPVDIIIGLVVGLTIVTGTSIILVVLVSVLIYFNRRRKSPTKQDKMHFNTLPIVPTNNTHASPIGDTIYCEVQETCFSNSNKEPSNFYHVKTEQNPSEYQEPTHFTPGTDIEGHYTAMVGGEVIKPSMHCKLPGENMYTKSNTIANPIYQRTNMASEYMEPPKNLSELKEMLTAFMHELRAEDIEMGEEFASGQFGVVYRGKYRTSVGDVPVAIKTLKKPVDANKDMKVAFMREAAILAQFHHPNVLRLIGIVTTQQPWMMITELLKTELKQLLLQIRPAMLLLSSPSSSPDKLRIHTLLLSFSQQIAAGMEHLAEKKFIHRDLAARNVLVAKDLSVRVADFGMSREIDSDNDYYSSSGGRVPLRWTSPEALFYKKYSEKSDVWSFGMTLYEIWSLGDKPWEGYKNDEIIEAITNGQTPPQPVSCSHQMYQLMLQTWNRDAKMRPKFSEISRVLSTASYTL